MEEKKEKLKYIRYKDAIEMYGLSQRTLDKLVKESGAYRKVGKAVLINVVAFDNYIESFKMNL